MGIIYSKKDWSLSGNSDVTSNDFIGSTNDRPVVVRSNNQELVNIDTTSINLKSSNIILGGSTGTPNLTVPQSVGTNGRSLRISAGDVAPSMPESSGGDLTLSSGRSAGLSGSKIRFSVAPFDTGEESDSVVNAANVLEINSDFTATYLTNVTDKIFHLSSYGNIDVIPVANNKAVALSATGTGVTTIGQLGTGEIRLGNTNKITRCLGTLKIDNPGVLEATISSTQTIAANTTATARFNATGFNRSITQDTNTGIITVPRSGTYLVNAIATMSANYNAGQNYKLLLTANNFTAPTRLIASKTIESNGNRDMELAGSLLIRVPISFGAFTIQIQTGNVGVSVINTALTNLLTIHEIA